MRNDKIISDSELILNPDGSVYHLKIHPADLADHIILVGDPARVHQISGLFDSMVFQGQNREFVIHTGFFQGKKITAMSTGMGTDNIDIVLNELDALVNIDLEKRMIKKKLKSLKLFRLGTSGSVQSDLPMNAVVVSAFGIGFDGMLYFYDFMKDHGTLPIRQSFLDHMQWGVPLPNPYVAAADSKLLKLLDGPGVYQGITATAPGFYGPQGRSLRLPLAFPEINEKLQTFRYNKLKILNYEMETSALYGLSRMLGHQAITVCLSIANRQNKVVSQDYHPAMEKLIHWLLARIVELKD